MHCGYFISYQLVTHVQDAKKTLMENEWKNANVASMKMTRVQWNLIFLIVNCINQKIALNSECRLRQSC